MIGTIIGDIVGSRFEYNNCRDKWFQLFEDDCFYTDDTVMALAVAHALRWSGNGGDIKRETVVALRRFGAMYPDCDYGARFAEWLKSGDPKPYGSYGNGAAMRVGACAYVGDSLREVKELARSVTEVTHNHPEGIKGAEAVAVATYLARIGASKSDILPWMAEHYYPCLRSDGFTIDKIRESYRFDESCQGTVPQALEAFFESKNYEDAIRIAVSVGGDSDTLAAITGTVAEAHYGVPVWMRVRAEEYLDEYLRDVLHSFERIYER